MLRPSYSLLLVYEGKYLYDAYLNNEQCEHKCNQLGCSGIPLLFTVVYLQVSFVMKILICTPKGEMNNMICGNNYMRLYAEIKD